MNQQIEKFITNNYYELLKITNKITKNHSLTKDLLHDCILQILEKDKITLREYTYEQIKYYIVSVIRLNWFSKTSPFYYRIRREFKLYNEFPTNFDLPDTQQLEFEIQVIYDILEEGWSELDWFHKSIMELYLTLGSIAKLSEQTKIPISSIRRYIKESREKIKSNFKEL